MKFHRAIAAVAALSLPLFAGVAQAAELKVRLGKSTEALADFETLLGKLDPESWLYREVRRKVEEVFLRTDDLAGLDHRRSRAPDHLLLIRRHIEPGGKVA